MQRLPVLDTSKLDPRQLVAERNLLGQAPAFQRALTLARRSADCDATVLIHGETRTGKELVARAIHHVSRRHVCST